MIRYRADGIHIIWHIFRMHGSVFPKCLIVALPASIFTGILCATVARPAEGSHGETLWTNVIADNAAWNGFVFVVGFMVVFRTSQAYRRFCDGVTAIHQMRAEWFDACSSLVAFCRHADESKQHLVNEFLNKLVRFFSMLHAMSLSEMEDCARIEETQAIQYELVDVEGLDEISLHALRISPAKVELVFNWIQCTVVDSISIGVMVIPPPILSRAFQELANGMVRFHDAITISTIPFPFPYAQTCDVVLIVHWLLAPFVVTQFVNDILWGMIFSFIQVFVLWALNLIAVELENPYGQDANDIDGKSMHAEFNNQLLMLIHPDARRVPTLVEDAEDLLCLGADFFSSRDSAAARSTVGPDMTSHRSAKSFSQAWINLDRKKIAEKTPLFHGSSSDLGVQPSIRRTSTRTRMQGRRASDVALFSVLLSGLPTRTSSAASSKKHTLTMSTTASMSRIMHETNSEGISEKPSLPKVAFTPDIFEVATSGDSMPQGPPQCSSTVGVSADDDSPVDEEARIQRPKYHHDSKHSSSPPSALGSTDRSSCYAPHTESTDRSSCDPPCTHTLTDRSGSQLSHSWTALAKLAPTTGHQLQWDHNILQGSARSQALIDG